MSEEGTYIAVMATIIISLSILQIVLPRSFPRLLSFFDFLSEGASELFGRIRQRCDKRLMQIEKEETPLIKKFVDDCVSMLFISGDKDFDVVTGELCKVFSFKRSDFIGKQIDTVNDSLKKLIYRFELIRDKPNRMRKQGILYRALELIEACEELYWIMRLYTLYESGHHRLHYLIDRFHLVFVQSFMPFFLEELALTPSVISNIYYSDYGRPCCGYEYV